MGTWEFPLVLFTVFSQWAIGLVIMITLVEYVYPTAINETNRKHLRVGGMAVLPLLGLAMLSSLFHLGQPMAAAKAITNLGSSMLSLEIAAFSVVFVLALLYSYVWWKTPEKEVRKVLGAVLGIGGLMAVVISSKVYTLPARPAWDSWHTMAAFVLTVFILGAVSVAYLLSRAEDDSAQKAKKMMGWTIIGSIAAIVLVLASFAQTFGASPEQSTAVAATFSSSIFYVRLVFGILLPAVLAGLFLANHKSSSYLLAAALAGVVLGEVAGRILFYASVMGQYPWF